MSKKNNQVFFLIYKTISFSLVLQFVLSFLVFDFSQFRQTIFFNNPNQLGYFALCNLTIFLYLAEYYKMNKFLFILTLLSGIYLTVISLSNAAIIALVLLLIVNFFKYIKKAIKYLLIILIALLIIVPFIPEDSLINTITTNVYLRITGIPQESDANLAGRGYDRIINHPEF